MTMKARLLISLLVVMPLTFSACGLLNVPDNCTSGYPRPNISAMTSEMTTARALWRAANIQNYRYVFSAYAFPGPVTRFRITVQDAQSRSIENINEPSGPAPVMGKTIDQQFDDIAAGIRGVGTIECGELTISYDAKDGHPLSLGFSNWTKGLQDGFGGWSITDFTRL